MDARWVSHSQPFLILVELTGNERGRRSRVEDKAKLRTRKLAASVSKRICIHCLTLVQPVLGLNCEGDYTILDREIAVI